MKPSRSSGCRFPVAGQFPAAPELGRATRAPGGRARRSVVCRRIMCQKRRDTKYQGIPAQCSFRWTVSADGGRVFISAEAHASRPSAPRRSPRRRKRVWPPASGRVPFPPALTAITRAQLGSSRKTPADGTDRRDGGAFDVSSSCERTF